MFESRFQNVQKWPVFILLKIVSFSNDIVGPIDLINAIIINYQFSIERSALEFTVIFKIISGTVSSLVKDVA